MVTVNFPGNKMFLTKAPPVFLKRSVADQPADVSNSSDATILPPEQCGVAYTKSEGVLCDSDALPFNYVAAC